jgi:hypothetical protein
MKEIIDQIYQQDRIVKKLIKNLSTQRTLITLSALFILGLGLMLSGCSLSDSPTAPQTSDATAELWNPQPGDQIVPGRDIPVLNSNYWESGNGSQVNPLFGDLLGIVFRLLGQLGGTVNLGYHSYQVPPGAVNSLTLFSLRYASGNAVAVDCGPSPLSFNTPVTLRLSYRNTQYDNGNPPPPLQIFYMDEDGNLEALPSTVNPGQKTVSAQVTHFSRYVLG